MARTSAYKVRIDTLSSDSSAIILLADGALVAILVELSEACHGANQGQWVIETAFGIDEEPRPANFAQASDAAEWLASRGVAGGYDLVGDIPELH